MVGFNSDIQKTQAYQPGNHNYQKNPAALKEQGDTTQGAPDLFSKKDAGAVFDKSSVLESMLEKSNASAMYGKTYGDPKLSEGAAKYYEQLKAKFGDMDFVLVSKDQKEAAQANAASFANPNKMVVLISEEEVEKMASDESFRSKYEGIIAMAKEGLSAMKDQFGGNDDVKGWGMKIDDDGNVSYFAVVKKANDMQAERIKEAREAKAAERKAEAKKEAKEAFRDKLDDARTARGERMREAYGEQEDFGYEVITASSIEELVDTVTKMVGQKVSQAEDAAYLGGNIDFMA